MIFDLNYVRKKMNLQIITKCGFIMINVLENEVT